MKKFLSLALTAGLLLSYACADDAVLPVFEWERDSRSHWQMSEDGNRTNLADHVIDASDLRCTVCHVEILDWGDGSYDVIDYDEYGNTLRYSSFDQAGGLISESIHAYAYDENGVVLRDDEFINGLHCGKTVYTVNEDGEQVPVSQLFRNDDGTISVNEYDAYGNVIRAYILESDGHILTETITEYALGADGWYYEAKVFTRFESGETFSTEKNEFGDEISTLNTNADGTPWCSDTYEYEYRNGAKVWSKQYSFRVLVREELFDEEGFRSQETEYADDGSKIVWRYNEVGDVFNESSYDADGALLHETVHVYEYTEYLEYLTIRTYENGVLTARQAFAYDQDGIYTGRQETVNHEDGSCTVTEYDADETVISTEEYAAEDSVTESDGSDIG